MLTETAWSGYERRGLGRRELERIDTGHEAVSTHDLIKSDTTDKNPRRCRIVAPTPRNCTAPMPERSGEPAFTVRLRRLQSRRGTLTGTQSGVTSNLARCSGTVHSESATSRESGRFGYIRVKPVPTLDSTELLRSHSHQRRGFPARTNKRRRIGSLRIRCSPQAGGRRQGLAV